MANTTSRKKSKNAGSAKALVANNSKGKVTISLGVTLSMGAGTYEFARIDIGAELPFDATSKTDREKVFEETHAWVKDKLQTEMQKIGKGKAPTS